MPSDSTTPLVFISYAHKDDPFRPAADEADWLEYVLEFLRPGEIAGRYAIWVDLIMMGSANWEPEIEQRLRACDIFILLVSRRSMAFKYILEKELPIVRERDARGEPIHIYPVLLTPTPMVGLDNVRDKNIRPRNATPLSGFSSHDRDDQMAQIADEIAKMSDAIADSHGAPAGSISSDAPGRTRRGQRLFVDIGHLPEMPYKSLVGRDAQLARLNAVWEDRNVNILSLVAEGGAGKSALVNEWLTRLRRDNYRGATAVLAWSFYSQGSKERATSADEFLNWALAKLGVKRETTSASAKGEAIAETLMTRRTLLLLDGVEPLQHGPGVQTGQLKDQGLRALLRRFAAAPPALSPGLIVLTSRAEVADIARWAASSAPVEYVERLTDEAGAELLRDNGVKGSNTDLRVASRDFGGHPLALTLLASLIKETQNGDVRRRDHIRGLLADPDNRGHDHAQRVMKSYEEEWLAGQPILLAILHLVGLFDRPASGDCLKALRAKPAIPGLADAIVDLSDDQWWRAVARLRDARLLAPVDPSDPEALDAHPLVREWFGDRLKSTNEAAWKAAHSRLYDHLRNTTHEGQTPTLADLTPLYHAVAHGCRAGRYQETLNKVYIDRICRWGLNGHVAFYASRILGAGASNLAAISWFFEPPYQTPVGTLPPRDRAWVLGEASSALLAQGRLHEALPAMRANLQMREAAQDWTNAAISASRLSETEALIGQIAEAVATGEKSVAYADRVVEKSQLLLVLPVRAIEGAALHAAGEREKSKRLFAASERRQRWIQPDYPLLHSLGGYLYCDLLLSRGRTVEARDRAARTLPWAQAHNFVTDMALDTLTLGRAHLALGLASESSLEVASADARAAAPRLDDAAEGLRASGRNEHVPRGLLARAAFRRAVGYWDRAARDLDEAQEIAEPGPMRLYLCDCALERARLALARR
jgi:tetratricopeptide (TPR) repeat protein